MIQIELKNIRLNERLSQETPCYSASLYADGVFIAEVGNEGHGGPDRVLRYAAGKGRADFDEVERRVKAEHPPIQFEGYDPLPTDLDVVCQTIVWDSAAERALRTKLRTYAVFAEGGRIKLLGGKRWPVADSVAVVRKKYPTAPILNELPFDEALRLWKAPASVAA